MSLEVVVAVRMPSIHLESFIQKLLELPDKVRVNIVLDHFSCAVADTSMVPKNTTEVRFWHGSFGSPGSARNFGLEKSKSEYIMFWDVDDNPNVKNLSEVIRYMNLTLADVGIGNWSSESKSFDSSRLDNTPFPVAKNPGLWRIIFRKQMIGDTRFHKWKWGEDQLFIAQIFEKQPLVVSLPFHIYEYREHTQGSLTSDKTNFIELFEAFKEMSSLYGETSTICKTVVNHMFLRQYLTLLKYGSFRIRTKATMALASALVKRKGFFPLQDLRKLKGANWRD